MDVREPAERSSESPSAAGAPGVPAQPPTAGTARPARLEALTVGAQIAGIDPRGPVRVIQTQWHGADCLDLTYRDPTGRTDSRLLYRDDEPRLFHPMLSVHTSLVEPLPHQIIAVYDELLPHQPLRFLLADDPGAGKTIMTGLFIKELMLRGDLKRCMVVCPGMLAELWQDELWEKFRLHFDIMTSEGLEAARTGNWLAENDLVICRLDKLSRNMKPDEPGSLYEKLHATDWDLVVVDEAHKMSATFFGGEVKMTQRHRLGRLLGGIARHFLLLTATDLVSQSLDRRRKRLEERLLDERLQRRGAQLAAARTLTDQELDDLDDAPDAEVEALEDEVIDQATASRTIEELEAEIATLKRLVGLAERVLKSGEDTKWNKLSELLQDNPEMFDEHGRRRKLVLFTEHRDTLAYLARRIRTLLGRDEALVTIAGGMLREERRKTQESFTQSRDVQILVATDAAGEGINLQRAHLLINYDLPWNPNRLEQRFGRIHRIGQTEVCHMWNLMATNTRESIVERRCGQKAFVYDECHGLSTEAHRYEATSTIINGLRTHVDHRREPPNPNGWLVTPETANEEANPALVHPALKLATRGPDGASSSERN